MTSFAYGVDAVRLRAPLATDTYSAATTRRDWANAASLLIPGCAFAPAGSTSAATVNREQITTEPTLYAPYAADIVPSDRIVVAGVTWEVSANGGQWRNPLTGTEAGSTFPLRLVEG